MNGALSYVAGVVGGGGGILERGPAETRVGLR